eukprot:TCALIF_05728-PA protein Name:"Similar to RDH13 Retinol dehydrogenase 13 (Homo sapiens)" AED:0.07 eAED:0.07 QI:2564/0.85/0.87/1/0.42/0.5/8/77/512
MAPMYSPKCHKKLNGKVVVLTGGNTGIGKETARDLSKRGARVIILCRDTNKGDAAAEEITHETHFVVKCVKLDLASLRSVRECAENILETEDKIDYLINNAGVMMCPYWKTEDGFDMQFGTNHLGHFLLTEMLLPLVKKSAAGGFRPRIVLVSSMAHESFGMNWNDINFEKSYNSLKAYCQSKLANVLHAKELAERLDGSGISVYSLHPVCQAKMTKYKGSMIEKRLDGKVIVITGANTGIGKETALDLSRRGARIIMLCRSLEKANVTADKIKQVTKGYVDVQELDLASLKSVRKCAQTLLEKEEKIDILINNAGVMLCPNWKTEDGFDMQFGTNHLGHFLLTELLLPLLRKSVNTGFHPRIVIVSSLAHESGQIYWDNINFEKSFSSMNAYKQSKLANVMHANELARRLESSGITVYSLHPGVVNTELSRHMKAKWYGKIALKVVIPLVTITPLEGAQTTLYCALEDSIEGHSGRYYSGCKEKKASARALDEKAQKRLWELSEKMVELKA